MVKMAAVHAPGDEVKDTQFEQVPLVENQMRKFTREEMREVLPVNVQNNVAYDLIRDPLRYAESALKISRMVGRAWKGASFLPFRRSSVPCHSKFDTEAIGQLFVPNSQRKRERKEAGEDRKAYNEKVWTKILRLEKVNAKMKNAGFSFHHEITTDGVAVSLLYSKVNYVHTHTHRHTHTDTHSLTIPYPDSRTLLE